MSALAPLVPADVEAVLDEVRPHLHGDVALVGIHGGEVTVRFSGRCADCTLQAVTLRRGVEQVLRARFAGQITLVRALDPAPDERRPAIR